MSDTGPIGHPNSRTLPNTDYENDVEQDAPSLPHPGGATPLQPRPRIVTQLRTVFFTFLAIVAGYAYLHRLTLPITFAGGMAIFFLAEMGSEAQVCRLRREYRACMAAAIIVMAATAAADFAIIWSNQRMTYGDIVAERALQNAKRAPGTPSPAAPVRR